MENFLNNVPFWVSLSFLTAVFFTIYAIANTINLGYKLATKIYSNSAFYIVFLIYFSLLAYTTVLSYKGILVKNSLPPIILVLVTIPTVILFSVFASTQLCKRIINALSIQKLISLHIFRLIGIYFFIAYSYNSLPKNFAFVAGVGDVTTALTSFIVVYCINAKKNYWKKIVIVWNVFGLIDILAVMINAIIATNQSLTIGTLPLTEITKFPFCFIPAFAPATIIFLHLCIFKKINQSNQNIL